MQRYKFANHNFATRTDATQKLLRYGVLGGTAQYQVWAGQASLREILKRRILTKDEPLFEEPLQLIRGESAIRQPGNYYEVLQQSKISSGQLLTCRLDRLAKLRYIDERRPIGGNGSPGWSVSDPFFRFGSVTYIQTAHACSEAGWRTPATRSSQTSTTTWAASSSRSAVTGPDASAPTLSWPALRRSAPTGHARTMWR